MPREICAACMSPNGFCQCPSERTAPSHEQAVERELEAAVGRIERRLETEVIGPMRAQLAAANALLREIANRVGIPWALHGNLVSRLAAHLSAQPVAPTFKDGRCTWCGTRQPTNFADGDGCTDCGKRGQPVAQSGAPGHTFCDYEDCDQEPTVTLTRGAVMCEHHAAVALLAGMSPEDAASTFRFARPVPETERSAADKAVLDAMGELDIEMLKAVRNGWSAAPAVFHPPCLAELARRELKP